MKQFKVHLIGLLVLILSGSSLSGSAFGQTAFWKTVVPDATLVIKRHPMGADLVEVTVLGSKYPSEALKAHIMQLGVELGAEPRGLAIAPVGLVFLKATFAVNGLISDTEPRFRLAEIARAFAFGDKPLRQLSVLYSDELPNDKTPARWFAPNDAWMLEAVAMKKPVAIEYRIKVNTNDPKEVTLPGSKVAIDNKVEKEAKKKPDYLLIGALSVAAISLGLLVYSALIRGQRRAK